MSQADNFKQEEYYSETAGEEVPGDGANIETGIDTAGGGSSSKYVRGLPAASPWNSSTNTPGGVGPPVVFPPPPFTADSKIWPSSSNNQNNAATASNVIDQSGSSAFRSFPPSSQPTTYTISASRPQETMPTTTMPGSAMSFWGSSAASPPPHMLPPPLTPGRFMDPDGIGPQPKREGATSPTQIELSHRTGVVHMGCTCKKTRCLKLYCQCFGIKIYCGANCRCSQCFNTQYNEKVRKEAMKTILQRNPMAFDNKFKKSPTTEDDKGEFRPALAHKLGCKCRKSACMKKYCECYAGNVPCGGSCRCVGCKNNATENEERAKAHYESALYPLAGLPTPAQVMQPAGMPAGNGAAGRNPDGTMIKVEMGSPVGIVKQLMMPYPQEEGGGMNSLMMAAYAMTEFGQGSSSNKGRLSVKAEASTGDNSLQDDDGPEAKKAKMSITLL